MIKNGNNENISDWSFDDIAIQANDLETAKKIYRTKYQKISECDNFEQLVDITYGKRGTPSREAYEEECEEWLREK